MLKVNKVSFTDEQEFRSHRLRKLEYMKHDNVLKQLDSKQCIDNTIFLFI